MGMVFVAALAAERCRRRGRAVRRARSRRCGAQRDRRARPSGSRDRRREPVAGQGGGRGGARRRSHARSAGSTRRGGGVDRGQRDLGRDGWHRARRARRAARPITVVVDLVYHPMDTPLLVAARDRGARAIDGVGMLVHQGALAFTPVDRESNAPIDTMHAAARGALAARARANNTLRGRAAMGRNHHGTFQSTPAGADTN